MMKLAPLLCLIGLPAASFADTVLLDEHFAGNAAGWQLKASGYGKPVARIADGVLLVRPDSGGGESSNAEATLVLPVPHANVSAEFTAAFTEGTFWSHRVLFELMGEGGRALGGVGLASEHSAAPGTHVSESSTRFHALVSRNEELARRKPQSFRFNLHDLFARGSLQGVDESRVRGLRITVSDAWMGSIAVPALKVAAGEAKAPAPFRGAKVRGLNTVEVGGVRIGRAPDSLAWGSLERGGDNVLKALAAPAGPFRVRVKGAAIESGQFDASGLCKAAGLRGRLETTPVPGGPAGRLRLSLALANESGADLEVQPSILYLPGLHVGHDPWGQAVAFPLYFGFSGSLETFARGGGGFGTYPQPMSMQFVALCNPADDRGIAVYVRDPDVRYKELALRVSEYGDTACEIATEPVTLHAGGKWSGPPVVLELTGGSWYPSARRYGDWWRSCIGKRPPTRWLARAGQMLHMCPGHDPAAERDGKPVPYPEYLPDLYRRFQQRKKETPTPITFDIGAIPDEKRGGAAGEHAGSDTIRAQARSRTLLYMPGITEYDFLPVSTEKKGWYVLRPDGSMLPAWLQNATFCPGFPEVIRYRVGQAVERVTTRGADGIYVDESCAQSYHTCYNPLHHHATPYDWGRSQRALFKAIREGVDGARGEAGMTTEGCCDVVADYVDAYCWGIGSSGQGEGAPPMRVAFPERNSFSYLGGGRPGLDTRRIAALMFVNGLGYWFVNSAPPEPEWTGLLAMWRERLAGFLIAGEVLRDPVVTGGNVGDVVARAYGSGGRVLLAAVNLGKEPWSGRLVRPAKADWPQIPTSGKEMLSGKDVRVAAGAAALTLGPGEAAAVVLRP